MGIAAISRGVVQQCGCVIPWPFLCDVMIWTLTFTDLEGGGNAR